MQFQYWSQLTETVNLLNVAALNCIFNKKAELHNMCVVINFIESFSLLILRLTDLSFWEATLGVVQLLVYN